MAEIHEVFNIPGAKFTLMADGSKFPPIIPIEGWQLHIDVTTLVHAIMAIPGVSLNKNGNKGGTRGTKPISESTTKVDVPGEADNSPVAEPDTRSLSYCQERTFE